MRRIRIVSMIFSVIIIVLVIIGITKKYNNNFEEEIINVGETTGSCFMYNDTYDGVRVINYKISKPDSYFVDLCKKIISTDDMFETFKNVYKSNDNYSSFCSNKSNLSTNEDGYISSINLNYALNSLLSTGEIDISNYEYDEKYYVIEDNNIDRCVSFLKEEGFDKDILFDYCSGKNTINGNLYQDNQSYMYSFNMDSVYKLIKNNILTENTNKVANIYYYDNDCGDTINIPNKLNGLDVYSISVKFNNAKVLLLPSSLKRIDMIDGLNVRNLTIPKNVIYIESFAFNDSNIENVIFNGNTYISGEAFNNRVKTVKYNGTCDEINNIKYGFSNYKDVSFNGKKGKCVINEE